MKLFIYHDGVELQITEAKSHKNAIQYFMKIFHKENITDEEVQKVDEDYVSNIYTENENEIFRMQRENDRLEKFIF